MFHWYVIEHPHPRRRALPYQAKIPVAALDTLRIVGLHPLHRVFEGVDGILATADDTHGSRSCIRDAGSSSARRGAGSRATAARKSAIASNAR